jgi:hypothetical protein
MALTILGAVWGPHNVTPTVAGLVKNDSLAISWKDLQLPDPWAGVKKTLVVVYQYDGHVPRMKLTDDDGSVSITPADGGPVSPPGYTRPSDSITVLGAVYGKLDVSAAVTAKIAGGQIFDAKADNATWSDGWPGFKKTFVLVYATGPQRVRTVVVQENDPIHVQVPPPLTPISDVILNRLQVPFGVTSESSLLSCTESGALSLVPPADNSGQETWAFVPVTGLPDQFNIVLAGVADSAKRFLSSSQDGGAVEMSDRDDGSGRQRWKFVPVQGSRSDYFNIVVSSGGPYTPNTYLSCIEDGSQIILASEDDASGRQRWQILKLPQTVITPGNIPEWYCDDVVDLAAYLKANAERNVVRIFAREVVLDRPLSCKANVSRVPIDIRIDCQQFTILGSPTIDLSGVNSKSAPDPSTVLSWGSYCPTASAPAAPGERGYDGGRMIVNTRTIWHFPVAGLTLLAAGGNAGNGQSGYPGRPGAKGQDGVDWKIRRPGISPTNGARGEAGGNGGAGGRGGDGGHIEIRYNGMAQGIGDTLRIGKNAAAGDGGTGGEAGRGGPGGPPGNPSFVLNLGLPPAPILATAKTGLNGADGQKGADGDRGSDGTVLYSQLPMMSLFQAMQEDTQPESFRVRLHALLTAAIYSFMRSGDRNDFQRRIDWLNRPAGMMGYDDVMSRLEAIYAFLAAAPANTDWAAAFRGQLMTMRGDTLTDQLTMLKLFDDSPAAPSAAHLFLARLRSGFQAAALKVSGTPASMATTTDDPDPWTAALDLLLATITPDSSQFDMARLIGDHACVTAEGQNFAASVTPADLAPPASPIRPQLFWIPVAAVAAVILVVVNGTLIGLELSQNDLVERMRGREEDERKRDEELRRKRDEYVKQLEKEVDQWRQVENDRDVQDFDNGDQFDQEQDRARRRRERDRERDDYEPITVLYGARFIGILDSLDPVEVDGESTEYIAVFDGYVFPGISNDVIAAAFMMTTFRHLSFMLRLRIDAATAQTLTPGRWHVVLLTPAETSEETLQPFIYFPNPELSGGSPKIFWSLVGLPELPVTYRSILPLSPELAAALDFLLQFIQVPVKETPISPPGPQPLAVAANIDQVVTQNIGMAAFHTFDRGANRCVFAFDVGYGTPIGLTNAAIQKLQTLAARQVPIVMSHWDRDHYNALTNLAGVLTIQANNPIVGPSYGLIGATISKLIAAIAGRGPNRLFLVGTMVANYVNTNPVFQNAKGSRTIGPVMASGALQIPGNISLALTTRAAQAYTRYDKNNTEAITAYITQENIANLRLLLPGDASFWYVANAHRQNLSHLEASHHGSRRSVLTSTGGPNGTPTNNDIPPSTGLGTVVFSYGNPNGYGITPAAVGNHYQQKQWTVLLTTPVNSNLAGEIDTAV